ncbi:radical SAM protein [Anaerophaga thermohalophila]|uniref:radical SAM protein n=1 Tax=Anaerophaga thermohalophila TaxID=177400 RepID=UPI000237B95E|nr:radical SAM protein [Anaerophaga thermohalophila]
MKRRKIKKGIYRLAHLPGGINFVRYCRNKVAHYSNKVSGSLEVAHPSTIMLEVSNHCNLHCITCPREYAYGIEMDKGYMDISLLKRLVDEAYPYIDSIGLTGMGEPLLYPHLAEALEYIKSRNRGILTNISTNAVLSGAPEIIDTFKANLDTIQISIDGIGDVYNSIRKNADYDTFIDNVAQIQSLTKNSGTDLTFNMVVVKENYHQMPELIELAAEKGFANLTFTIFNLASVTNVDMEYYEFYDSLEFREAYRLAQEKAKQHPELDVFFWNIDRKGSFQNCPFPWTHFYVAWNGEVPPCCAKPFPKELSFGSVVDQPLINVLNTDGFKEFRKMWKTAETPAFCRRCHFIMGETVN